MDCNYYLRNELLILVVPYPSHHALLPVLACSAGHDARPPLTFAPLGVYRVQP